MTAMMMLFLFCVGLILVKACAVVTITTRRTGADDKVNTFSLTSFLTVKEAEAEMDDVGKASDDTGRRGGTDA